MAWLIRFNEWSSILGESGILVFGSQAVQSASGVMPSTR
jgi:hypothetical protein